MGNSRSPKRLPARRVKAGVLAITIACLSFITYRNVFDNFFTASDAFTLIETGRLQSLRDVLRIFSEPVMHGTGSETIGLWYRPLHPLSFGIDYVIWGLNPFGYNLTNVLLHSIAGILVFFFTLNLARGRLLAAWLAAALFVTHPISVETVAATVRRPDMLQSVFLVLSLWALHRYHQGDGRRRGFLAISLIGYALALLSKETAVILFPLVFIFEVLFSARGRPGDRRRAAEAFRGTLFFLITTVGYVAWRAWVLQAMHGFTHRPLGGYENRPWGMLGTFRSQGLEGLWRAGESIVRRYVVDLFYLHGPADAWFPSVRGAFIHVAVVAILLGAVYLFWHYRKSLGTRLGRNAIFLTSWILLPLAMFLAVNYFGHRSMYLSLIPLCIMLGILIEDCYARIEPQVLRSGDESRGEPSGGAAMGFAGAGVLALSLMAFSPLLHTYGEWEDSGRISEQFLKQLVDAAPQWPNDAVLHIEQLPTSVEAYRREVPHALSVTYLVDYGIKSWLDLHIPGNRYKVIVGKCAALETSPRGLQLQIRPLGEKDIGITVRPKY